jgi:hypothetical protein
MAVTHRLCLVERYSLHGSMLACSRVRASLRLLSDLCQ